MHHPPSADRSQRPEDGSWTSVATYDQLLKTSALEVIVGDLVLAIFRHQGKLYAVDGMCSHQGGPLAEGIVEHGCVTCPWHGWQYELETGIQTINRQPLQQCYSIREINGSIEVLL